MKESVARRLSELIKEAANLSTKLEFINDEPLADFHAWANDKPNLGLFKFRDENETTIHFFIPRWGSRDNEYALLLFHGESRLLLLEATKVENEHLMWAYAPRKRDGKNVERKQHFARIADLQQRVGLPHSVGEVLPFLEHWGRIVAVRLDVEASIGCVDDDSDIADDETPEEDRPEKSEVQTVAVDGPRTLFNKVEYDVGTLLKYIQLGDIGLPDIQRPFVWPNTRVRDLFDSMYRGFPVGYLLFWSNSHLTQTKQIGTGEKQTKIPRLLIVDGQQRLTSLYAVFKGSPILDDDFRERRIEIAFRPRDGRFSVADAAARNDPEIIADISELWTTKKSSRAHVNDFLKKLKSKKALSEAEEEAMSHNLDRLFDLVNYGFTALEILPDVEEDSVSDIFVRINSEGVKLNTSDFILTLLSVFWEDGRRALEEFSRKCHVGPSDCASPYNHFVKPTPDQLVKVSVPVGFHRARLKAVYHVLRGKDLTTGYYSSERRDEQFVKLKKAQEQVLDLSNWHAFLGTLADAGYRSNAMISSANAVLYCYAFYLLGKSQCQMPDRDLRKLIARWFFSVCLTGRYSVASETRLEQDLNRIRDAVTPDAFRTELDKMVEQGITPDFWDITVPSHLITTNQGPQVFAYYAAQVKLGAVALFSTRRIADLLDPTVQGSRNAIERHHLFPKKWLERTGVTARSRINQVANYAWVEWPDNMTIGARSPAEYVPMMRETIDDASWERMCRLNALPTDWFKLKYPEFLEQRRHLIAELIHDAFRVLHDEPNVGILGDKADGTAIERRTWEAIERLELLMRRRVRLQFQSLFGKDADRKIEECLGKEAWEGVVRNRDKDLKRRGGQGGTVDVVDYMYLGQLSNLVTSGGWQKFSPAFRDKRAFQDLISSIAPVRNDRAHFRTVAERDLQRCEVACHDLIEILSRENATD